MDNDVLESLAPMAQTTPFARLQDSDMNGHLDWEAVQERVKEKISEPKGNHLWWSSIHTASRK